MMRCAVLVCLILAAHVAANYPVNHYTNILIDSFDGTKLSAGVYAPVPQNSTQRFPAIVYVNSWDLGLMEYIVPALQFAERGYVCLYYEARGWYKSGSEIDVAGNLDMMDHRWVMDWLINSTLQVDPTKIGAAGISYGAGISLLAAANDSRIAAVASMSGWGSLVDAMWGGQSPAKVWGEILVLTAPIMHGKEPEILKQYFQDLLNYENVTGVLQWASLRGLDTYLDQLNSRSTVPILVSNNNEDRLFKPNYILDMWVKIKQPKRLELNQGIHASAEIGGLLDLPNNYVWNRVRDWFDHYLQGINNGINNLPPVCFQARDPQSQRIEFASWPSPTIVNVTYALQPRGHHQFGTLSAQRAPGTSNDTIRFEEITGMSAGIPVVGPILQVYVDVPITADLPLTSRSGSVVYLSDHTLDAVLIAGTPVLTITVIPSDIRFQVDAYLYSVDGLNIGTLISHATVSEWTATPNTPQALTLTFRTLAYNFPKGHKLGLGINLFCDLYGPASTDHYTVALTYDSLDPTLYLPVQQQ